MILAGGVPLAVFAFRLRNHLIDEMPLVLAASGGFAAVTFSDDWHAVINDGVGTTALSVVSGILIATILIATRRLGR